MKLSNISWYDTYKLWLRNSGYFEYLFKSAPFVSARYLEDFQLGGRNCFEVSGDLMELVTGYNDGESLIILDTDASEGISFAVALNNQLCIAPILSYNFLFHPYGIVGNKAMLEDLLAASKVLRPIEPHTYAFILDSNRYRSDANIDNPMVFNNQYEITEEEMPDVQILRKLDKKSIAFFYRGNIKEDISCYLEHLKANDFIVYKVNLEEVENG